MDDAGVPLSVGSKAVLRATQTPFPVGYDGEAYVQDLSALNQVDAELPNGRRCTAVFDYLPVKGNIPTTTTFTSSFTPGTPLIIVQFGGRLGTGIYAPGISNFVFLTDLTNRSLADWTLPYEVADVPRS